MILILLPGEPDPDPGPSSEPGPRIPGIPESDLDFTKGGSARSNADSSRKDGPVTENEVCPLSPDLGQGQARWNLPHQLAIFRRHRFE